MQGTRQRLEAILRERIAVLDGSWGVLIQRELRGEDAYRGERFRDHSHDVAGDPDLLNITRPEVVSRIHDDYFAAGADIATTNTFTATTIGQADYALRRRRRSGDELRGRTPCATRRGRLVGTHARPAAFRRGSGGPAKRDALAFAASRRPVVPRRHVRASARRLRAPDPRAARRGRRPAACRDGLRLAEREGGDRRRARGGARRAALALVHGDRQERPQPLRPDGGGVLALRGAREAADRRRELLARRGGDAAVRGGHGGDRVDLGRVLPERRAAERVRAARRAAARHEPPPRRVRTGRPRQRRGRLLRHDAGSRARDRRCGRGRAAARASAAAPGDALQRPRAVRDHPRHELRDDRRAHEPHRLGALSPPDRGRRVPGGARGRARTGARWREPARRQHGRRPARRRRRR